MLRARARLVDLVVAAFDGIADDQRSFPASVLAVLCEEIDAIGGAWRRVDPSTGEQDLVLHGRPSLPAHVVRRAARVLRHPDLRVGGGPRGLAPVTGQQAAGGASAWRRSPCCRALESLLDAPQVVHVGLRDAPVACGLAFARSGADFAPAALDLLAQVQPVLSAVDRCVARLGREQGRAPATEAAARLGLTAREVEVLGLVAQGLTAGAVSRRLGCSPRTVHKHVSHLFEKLHVHDRLGAVLEAQRLGLLRGASPARSVVAGASPRSGGGPPGPARIMVGGDRASVDHGVSPVPTSRVAAPAVGSVWTPA